MRLGDPTPYVTEVLLQAEMFEAEASGGGDGELARLADTARVLSDHAPGDPGILAALLMNRVTLQPGQAIFLDAGNLHAYLHGAGIEIMANSDNVLRGGLTSKHVDVDALVSVLDFSPIGDDTIGPEPVSPRRRPLPHPGDRVRPVARRPVRRTRRRPGDRVGPGPGGRGGFGGAGVRRLGGVPRARAVGVPRGGDGGSG